MNGSELYTKLMAVARAHPPSEAVPYLFEKRIMACLAAAAIPDHWTLWSKALWRAAVPSIGIMMILGALTYYSENKNGLRETLDTQLENTILAAIDHAGDAW